MKKIEAIIRPERLSHVRAALDELGLRGLNVVPVSGSGQQRGVVHQGRGGEEVVVDILPRLKVELVITDRAGAARHRGQRLHGRGGRRARVRAERGRRHPHPHGGARRRGPLRPAPLPGASAGARAIPVRAGGG